MAYSSKYYDPVKAHEYYEAHKKLKGRTSTKGLNDKGKEAAKFVKEQINAEKKEWNNRLKEILSQRIKELKESMKGMSKEEKAAAVKDLREKFKAIRDNAKEAFKEKYAQELDKIKQDKQFRK